MVRATILLILLLASAVSFAQDQKASATPVSPSARLAAAKTAFVRNGGGSEIPYNVIESGIEGWGRFTLVDSPVQADVIIEVQAPEEQNGTSVSSSTDSGGHVTSNSSRDISVAIIKLTVYDSRTHLLLWSGYERPKGGFKEKTRDDNLVKAAETLVSRFRDHLEPPPADAKPATNSATKKDK